MEISSLARSLRMRDDVNLLKATQDDLSRQLVSGKKAETYGGLGSDASVVLSLRDQISALEGYVKTMELVNLRLGVQSAAMTRMDEIASTLRTDSLTTSFDLTGAGQTQLQLSAASQFDEIASLLNTELEGRHMFGGTDTAAPPVAVPELMLRGDTTRAGLEDLIADRAQADMGPDNRGRLTIGTVGATFTVAEDADPSVFGAKLVGVTSTLNGTMTTGPVGSPPSLDVAFTATLPQQGETITVEFTMPDGTSETLTLTATSTAPAGENEFLIGADANTTATNFQTAFDTSLQEMTQTSVKSASAAEAANDFFESNPPQRVNGAPLTSATGLVDGTTANTVFWYTGDTSSNAPALAKIGENETVSYGVRGDDSAIIDLMKSTAVLAVTTFTGVDPLEEKAYSEMVERVADTVAYTNTRSPLDGLMEMGFLQAKIDGSKEQAQGSISVSKGIVDGVENADSFEVAAKLGVVQTQLEAAFQVTARINELSLLNFLR
jgi:flagellar hook-associated protein 3 FlgL